MKNYFISFILGLLAFTLSKGQASWNKSIDFGFQANYGYSALEYNNDEYVVAGVTYQFDKPAGLVLKVNREGNSVWERGISFENQSFYLYKAFKIFESQIWTTGLVEPGNSVTSDPAIVVYNDDGTEIFRKVFDNFVF